MNPKLILSAISRNRAVMEAQIDKLAALPSSRTAPEHADVGLTTASLLQRAMLGHLQGAEESLLVLNDVDQQDDAVKASDERAIIDSVATVINDQGDPG